MTEIIISKSKSPDHSQFEARVVYILMKAGVTGPEIDECVLWAFGTDAWYVPIFPDWVDRWHKLHPKQFKIKRNDSFVEMMYVIGFLFCVEKKKAAMKVKP